jgi:hypothetical protein
MISSSIKTKERFTTNMVLKESRKEWVQEEVMTFSPKCSVVVVQGKHKKDK